MPISNSNVPPVPEDEQERDPAQDTQAEPVPEDPASEARSVTRSSPPRDPQSQ